MLTISVINCIVLFVTAVIIALYTIYTYKLFKETEKQTELSLRPFIVVYINGKDFYVRNIGSGTAIDIEIKDLYHHPQVIDWLFLRFDKINSLIFGEEKKLNIILAGKEEDGSEFQKKDWSMEATLRPEYAREDYDLSIEYKNIVGKIYNTKIQIGKSGIKIKSL